MLLAVDVGNTQTVFGLFDGSDLAEHWRIATKRHRSGDELGAQYKGFLDLGRVDGISLASTVPQLSRSYHEFAGRYTGAELLELGPGVKTGIVVRYDEPREVGPDRVANAVAAADRYGPPCIVVDFGTSTNFDVVSADGEYVGGVLAPGTEISMDALFEPAARLPKVDFAQPQDVFRRGRARGRPRGTDARAPCSHKRGSCSTASPPETGRGRHARGSGRCTGWLPSGARHPRSGRSRSGS